MEQIYYHALALTIGFLLDLIIGDPVWMPHPIRLIGKFIAFLDNKLNNEKLENEDKSKKTIKGILTWILVVSLTGIITLIVIRVSYFINLYFGIIVEVILSCYILATKSLKTESMKVYKKLSKQDLEGARYAVSMIVGRDTKNLDEIGITKAAVETIAENASDGVIAPLLYLFLGGPVLGMIYKAINTMDSMLGYHNDKYEYFGRWAAKADDIANFIPSRISAYALLLGSIFNPSKFDIKNGFKIYKRDRFNHKSPNSAQTESAVAGLLNIRLAGPAVYFGKTVNKPFIGDDNRPISKEDIVLANRIMYIGAWLTFVACIIVYMIIIYELG